MLYRLPALVLLATSAPAAAQTPLFQNTTSGMSVEQVLAAQPTAVRIDDPGKGFGPAAPCLAEILSYEIAGNDYEVCFIFEAEQLEVVRVAMKRDPLRFDYMAVLTMLRSKYAPELAEGPTELGRKAQWLTTGGTDIALHYHTGPLITGLNISYSEGAKSDANKL